MRALVIALMMVLLPLRGWVGDAMAQAAATPLLQAAAHADSQHDCALHPGGTEMAQDDASHQTHEFQHRNTRDVNARLSLKLHLDLKFNLIFIGSI